MTPPIRGAETGRGDLFLVLVVALAAAGATLAIERFAGGAARGAGSTGEVADLRRSVDALSQEIATLRAEQRTVAGLRVGAMGKPAASAPPREGDASLAGKPVESGDDASERIRRAGDGAFARGMEKARAVPTVVDSPDAAAETVVTAAKPNVPEPAPEPTPEPAIESALDPMLADFNRLLADAGLAEWRLLSASPDPEQRAFVRVVFSHRDGKAAASDSLSADRLVLERDPVTGVAAFVLTGARGTENGIGVAYPDGMTRLEIPGLLPLELVPSSVAAVLTHGTVPIAEEPGANERIVQQINRVLALHKAVALRLRTIEKVEDGKLKKAVIDLEFDDRGVATKSVLADVAWFEIDATARYGELCCEGGDMVEGALKRALYHGKVRLPLRDLDPEQWRGVAATHATPGS